MRKAIVVTPVYNARRYIKACALSVRDNLDSYPNIVHIIVDDCSTDGTYERAGEGDISAPHLTVIRKTKNGASALGSFVHGVGFAYDTMDVQDDDVFFWLDGDDWLCDNDAIKKMMRPYERNDEVEMVYSDHLTWFGETKVGGSHSHPLGERSNVRSAMVAYSHFRSFKANMIGYVPTHRLRDPNGEYWKFAGDSALFLPMLEVAKRVKYIKEPLYIYNMEREDNEIKKDPEMQSRCSVAIREQVPNTNNRPDAYPETEFAPTSRFKLDHGRACNLGCKFCYYLHEKPWRNRPTAHIEQELIAGRNRGNRTCDISGGEPTIARDFYKWLELCSSHGIYPGIITHGQNLKDKLEGAWDRGLTDILFSVHGLQDYHNAVTNTEGKDGFSRLYGAIDKCAEEGFKFRTNTVLTENFSSLPVLAMSFAERQPLISNFINFNPYYGWEDADKPFQAKISDIAPSLKDTIDILVEGGTAVNVRYMPFCQMKGYEKHLVHMYQVMFDPYEWDYGVPKGKLAFEAHGALLAERTCAFSARCGECSIAGTICPGVNKAYLRAFGDGELMPYKEDIPNDKFHWRRTADPAQLYNYVGPNFHWLQSWRHKRSTGVEGNAVSSDSKSIDCGLE